MRWRWILLLIGVFFLHLFMFLFLEFRPYTLAPEGHTYTILGKNFFYPNMILQAKDGAWGIQDTHTTRPTPVVYAQWYFIVLGKIAQIYSIEPTTMYQLGRIVGGLLVFFSGFGLIALLLPSSAWGIAILSTFLLETGPLLADISEKSFWQWTGAFESHISILRHFGLPHHTTGQALGVLLVIVLFQAIYHAKFWHPFVLIVLSFIATTVLPPYIIVLILTVFPAWTIWGLLTKTLKQTIPPLLVTSLASMAAGIYIRYEFSKGAPWTNWTQAEKSWWTAESILSNYASSLVLFAPFLFLAWLCVPWFWKHWTKKQQLACIISTAWILGPFAYIPLSSHAFFPIANGRLTDGYAYIPAGILSALAIGTIWTRIHVLRPILSLCVAVVFGFSLVLTSVYLADIAKKQETVWGNVYPTTETWEGVMATKTIPKGSGVMVREYFGEILPGFANIRVFIGGGHGYLDWQERQTITHTFYSGELEPNEAHTLLKANDISYVFAGPDEQSLKKTPEFYPEFLTPVFENASVTIYRVDTPR